MAQASTAATQVGARIDSIQGLRAFAVLAVLAYHAHLPVPGGFVGVDIFFVISGFVIARLLLRGMETSGRVELRRFYRRRIRRLLPALAAMVTVTVLLSALIVSPVEGQSNTAVTGIGASVWLANVALYWVTAGYFAPDAEYATLLHTWSLAVEEQFYLVFPFLVGTALLLARRRFGGARAVLVALVLGASALSFLLNVWLCLGQPQGVPAPTGIAFFMPFTRAWEFGAGILVALAVVRPRRITFLSPSGVAIAGLVGCLASLFLLRDTMVFPGVVAVLPVMSAAALIWGVARSSEGVVARTLAAPAAVRIGDLSYSLYLWHWPFVVFGVTLFSDDVVVRVLATALSVPVAVFCYRRIEEPIRRRHGRPVWRLAGTAVAIPVAASVLLLAGSSVSWGNAAIRDIKEQTEPRTYVQASCDASRERFEGVEICRREDGPGRPVVLLGDSNAQQYGNALAAATSALDRDYVVSVGPGCAMVEIDAISPVATVACVERTRTLLRWLDTQEPSVVVVSAANMLVDDDEFQLRDGRGRIARSTAAKAAMWERSLTATLIAIREAGHTVVQVRAIPHFKDEFGIWSPGRCSMPELLIDARDCNVTKSLERGDREHKAGLDAEQRAEAAAGVLTLDVRPEICPDGRCAARRGDLWVYREGMHLTEAMSEQLAEPFTDVVRSAG